VGSDSKNGVRHQRALSPRLSMMMMIVVFSQILFEARLLLKVRVIYGILWRLCVCCQFGMSLGSVISGLAQASVHQLSHMMSAVSDADCTKRDLIRVCNMVRRLYRGHAEMCQVCHGSAL